MKKLLIIAAMAFALAPAMAQNNNHGGHNCNGCPHHAQHQQAQKAQHNCGGKEGCGGQKNCTASGMPLEIVNAFPTAKSVKKEGRRTAVYDAKKVLLGYAVYSKPASDGIKGYNGETPLMIALDTKMVVKSVQLLDNNETPSYLQKVVAGGLLKSWDGMKAAKAAKKKVDTVSGATYTSRSIIQTLQAALKQL